MSSRPAYPKLRWLALAWLLVYVPSYTLAYGVMNFLFLCNVGVLLTAIGIFRGHQLLISTQALASPIIGLVWGLDAGCRLLTGDFLFGGTEYMWDPQYPVHTRLLSLYHVFWPPLVLWCVRKNGYDRRGWPLQVAFAGLVLLMSRLVTKPVDNVNYAFTDPFWGLQLGPAPLHLALVLTALGGVVYGCTHWWLVKGLRCPEPPKL